MLILKYLGIKSKPSNVNTNVLFVFVCLLFFILATSEVISGQVQTCDSAILWRLYGTASLGHQAASTVTLYPTRLHYPHTEPTSPCPSLIMASARLGTDMYQFYSHWFDSTRFQSCRLQTRTHDLQILQTPRTGGGCSTHSATLTVWPNEYASMQICKPTWNS